MPVLLACLLKLRSTKLKCREDRTKVCNLSVCLFIPCFVLRRAYFHGGRLHSLVVLATWETKLIIVLNILWTAAVVPSPTLIHSPLLFFLELKPNHTPQLPFLPRPPFPSLTLHPLTLTASPHPPSSLTRLPPVFWRFGCLNLNKSISLSAFFSLTILFIPVLSTVSNFWQTHPFWALTPNLSLHSPCRTF